MDYEVEKISEKDCKYFTAEIEDKYGVINENGETIIPNEYIDVTIPNPTKPVFVCQKQDESYEILNENKEKLFEDFGKVQVIELNTDSTYFPYEKTVLRYEKDGKYGIIDYQGKVITKPIYEEISSVKYKEGEILAKKDGKYGVINNKGCELIPFEYDEIEGDKYYSERWI